MFFLLQGHVNVFTNGVKVTTLYEGQYFGEIAMIAQLPRTATIIAGSACVLYKLSRENFLQILEEFDDVKEVRCFHSFIHSFNKLFTILM